MCLHPQRVTLKRRVFTVAAEIAKAKKNVEPATSERNRNACDACVAFSSDTPADPRSARKPKLTKLEPRIVGEHATHGRRHASRSQAGRMWCCRRERTLSRCVIVHSGR